jgi:hypothetical protein
MRLSFANLCIVLLASTVGSSEAINCGTSRVSTFNGWKAFEVISEGNDPSGDGFTFAMPGTFDGAGAFMVDSSTIGILVNHETSDASISEVRVDAPTMKSAISNVISVGTCGTASSFVKSARQAYDRWSSNGGSSWTSTSSASNTAFSRFCSGQAYEPNTFGTNRGFVDDIYITGEEDTNGRLFALDVRNRDFYQLSGVVGSASGGIGGMSYDRCVSSVPSVFCSCGTLHPVSKLTFSPLYEPAAGRTQPFLTLKSRITLLCCSLRMVVARP